MKMVRLGDVCTVVTGSTPKTSVDEYWNGAVDWITPAELTDDTYIINESQRKITSLAVEKTGLKPFPKDTVILSSRAPIGKVAIAGKEMYCNQGFKNLICSSEINSRYLYWYLKSKTEYLNSLGRGATFKELSKSIVENILIPLPSLEIQEKQVMILEKCSSIIKMYRKQIHDCKILSQSRFVEMFGDPIGNSMGLRTIPLGAACYLKAGITTSADAIHEYSTDYSIPCYGGNGIRGYVKEATQCGCYPIIGRQGALCGNIQLAMGEFHATEHAVLVTPLIEINVVWLFHLLKLMDLYRFHTGAAQPGLAVKTLNTVDIPIADIVEQDRFATFVRSIDKLKSHFLKLPVFPGLSVVKYVY